MKVKLADIIEVIESTDQNPEYFLDRETGEISQLEFRFSCSSSAH